SAVEKTALADAEVEYHDHTSTTIHVRFPVIKASVPALEGATVVIWTTTPWTIPGNRAVAYGEEFSYAVKAAAKITGLKELARVKGTDLAGTILSHPLRGKGYDFDVPMLPAAFVTLEAGSGFVHISPGAGLDDFLLGQEHGLEVLSTVDDAGKFHAHMPLVAGMDVMEDNYKIIKEAGGLLAVGRLVHSYPHSWRSKAPLIFRTTPQWFISMETNELREKALTAIDETRFVPARGRNRLHAMIEQRPDWCVSRQRTWGVPIPVFVNKRTGEPLRDQAVIDRIADIFEIEGSDAWFSSEPSRFLGNEYDAADYDQVQDVVEVWFDSGSTHSYVLEARPELKWPASLYLEGSDQHRGWFHTSLLQSCGTRGRAPFEAVLTHGFVLDESGRKMSKSLGNVTAPQDVIDQSGADILRLGVVGSDYSEDLRIGPEILKRQVDLYRRLRNTLRYLIGNLDGFQESERLDPAAMPELERWVLHRVSEIDAAVRKGIGDFDFHQLFIQVHNFCAVDLSAFYFDIRKDVLYCDAVGSIRRRAARTVLDTVFNALTAWLAPILVFTAEEAWQARVQDPENSVHLRVLPVIPENWRDAALAEKWARIRDVRRVVTGALEIERAEKRVGSSLQARPVVHVAKEDLAAFDGLDPADIFITSGALLTTESAPDGAFRLEDVADVAVVPAGAEGVKCERCWKVLPEVEVSPEPVCGRCAEALSMHAAAE
ncbi:MAG: class I tRNA ligase family protein, partial [Rickettsiales bacterium]